jgi:two-component sensor histidine kinase
MLVVGDDGVGIGCGSTLERTDSLGAHLVRTLARQLEGEVTWSANQGTEVRLIFPMEIAS